SDLISERSQKRIVLVQGERRPPQTPAVLPAEVDFVDQRSHDPEGVHRRLQPGPYGSVQSGARGTVRHADTWMVPRAEANRIGPVPAVTDAWVASGDGCGDLLRHGRLPRQHRADPRPAERDEPPRR